MTPIFFDGAADIAAPSITIDSSKCTTPMACKRCLQICPQAVFAVGVVKVAKYVETNIHEPGAYKLRPMYRSQCVACGECTEVCPASAITIAVSGET